MTICDKINEVGETLQENLNDRGVSCTFGVGTGESTVLDMVEMVNGTNFKGSSDVNLKICANRPYLLTGETTDIMVKLENGLCEPLKNKSVTVSDGTNTVNGVTDEKGEFGLYNISVTDNTTFTATYNNTITDTCIVYSCLLVDYATTNKHTDIWANMDIFTRGNDGTRAYYQNTGSSALQRWLTSRININGDVGIDLELVDCTLCRFQTGRYATGSTTTYEGFNFTEKGLVHFEIKSTGTYIYFNGNLVQSDTTETNLEQISLAFYVGANITANAKYKDLRIYYL